MMAGKYGDLIKKAREPENQNTNMPENQIFGNQESRIEKEPEVNLCVKVPKSLRQHWAAEAKRQGTTMTAVIIEALSDRFGKPD
jgi:predicted HicB family RNase H-like nuclease